MFPVVGGKMNDPPGLASMPLYTHVDRIARGLAARGIGPNDAIPPERLFALDQWHYHGTDAVRDAALFLGLGRRAASSISGQVSVVRRVSWLIRRAGTSPRSSCSRSCIGAGLDLTRRSGLADRVTHLCGDALTEPLPSDAFDAVISFLAVLHIADRPALMKRLADVLRRWRPVLHRRSLPACGFSAARSARTCAMLSTASRSPVSTTMPAIFVDAGLDRGRRHRPDGRLGALSPPRA